MAWPDTASNSGVMGSPAQVNTWVKEQRGNNRKTGRAKARSGGGGNSAGRAIFQRTLSRGKRS